MRPFILSPLAPCQVLLIFDAAFDYLVVFGREALEFAQGGFPRSHPTGRL
jgi:hypothetical protein